ncbi:hypothetical protein, partial [Providencia stuartii]|uniref:hypothetical protein n=1 Tax=Providencia stuartii TaxID=588 RepID=UPI0027EA88F6
CNPAYSKSIQTWLRFGEIMRGSLRAKLGLDKSGNLVWERFGNMKGASNKSLNQADKYIGDLMGNQKIMGQAKTQITQTMNDFKRILSDPSSSKNSIGLAERGIDKFSKMLEKFNELN